MPTEANYQSRTAEVYGSTISLMTLATFAVALRLLARSISRAKLWWDDWILVFALIFDYGLSICCWLQVIYAGLGRHTTGAGGSVTENEVAMFFKIFLPLQLFYFASSFAIKTSLILFYHRIFGVDVWFQRSLILAWLIVVLYFIVDFVVAIFECKPIAFFWDKSINGGSCINRDQFFRWNGVANLLIDFMILILTMPMIWNMNLQYRQKLSLTGVFLLGTFACAASIIRVTTFNNGNFGDITYSMVNPSIWSTVEQSIGIICACLITYQPLLRRMRSACRRTIDKNSTQGKTSKSVEMPNLSSTSPLKPSSDASTAGFARLYEENQLESGVKTHVMAGRIRGFTVVPEVIMKNQTIEQHRECVSQV